MVIGVNMRSCRAANAAPDEHYLRNLLTSIRRLESSKQVVLFTRPDQRLNFAGCTEHPLAADSSWWKGSARALRREIDRAGIEVLLTPLDEDPPACSARLVFYTLGLEVLQASDRPRRSERALKALRARVAQAAAVVVPSDYVRHQCHELLKVPLDRLCVVAPGVDASFELPQSRMIKEPYLLFVDGNASADAAEQLAITLRALIKRLPHYMVVISPSGSVNPADWGSRVLLVEQCPLSQRAGLYQHCTLYVNPARYDGAGFTLLEAMRAGAPIAAARVGAIPEIAGDAATYFDPERDTAIAAAVTQALKDDQNTIALRVRQGRQRAHAYTWEASAWKLLSALSKT